MNEDDEAGILIERLQTLEEIIPNFVEVEVKRPPPLSGFKLGGGRKEVPEQKMSPRLVTWNEKEVVDNHVKVPPWRRWENGKVVKLLVPAAQQPDVPSPSHKEAPDESPPVPQNEAEATVENTDERVVVPDREDKVVQTGMALAIDEIADDFEEEWRKERDIAAASGRITLQRCFSMWLERWYRVLFIRVATEARMNTEVCDFDFDDEVREEEEHTETKAFSSNPIIGRVYRRRAKARSHSRIDDKMLDDVLDMVLDDA